MSEKMKKTLVPTVRFPEFRNVGEWEEKELSKFSHSELSNGVFNDPQKVGRGYKLINVSDMYSDAVIDEAKLTLVELSQNEFLKNKVETGDVFFTRSSLVKSGIAYSNIYIGNSSDITFDGHLIRFRPNKDVLSSLFASYLLRTYQVRNQLVARGKSATMTTIGQADVSSVMLAVPSIKEQQKIADCLSSIDALISAQSQKVEALKTHKKGLMRQLFPREGETIPYLRFPEFRDAGAWEETSVGKLGELVSGLTYSPDDVRDSGLLVLRSSNVQNGEISLEDNVYVTPTVKGVNLSKPNDILICVRNGSKALIGKNALIPEGMPLCTHGAFMTVFRTQSAKFVFQLFQSAAYQNQVDADLGATINSINGGHFIKYKFCVPIPKEQKKIADCLSSIDALIRVQSQKIEALKTHKQGLMQALFPATAEVAV
jgi:type I restriction enzyme, S subunit